jgi:glyoxylase-like metal-dependent hydrolase (beta-lactamase superfamily II)
VAAGVRRWSLHYEDWGKEVGCVAIERGEGLVLVDPLLAPGHWPRLEAALGGRSPDIVLTTHWHARSSAEITARFPHTRVWAPRSGAAATRRRAPVTNPYAAGDELPGGLVAFAAAPRTETVLWDPASGSLIFADAVLGDGEGGLRLCPGWWLPRSSSLEELREKLRPLLDLPVERVLVSHGEPALAGTRAKLAAALA